MAPLSASTPAQTTSLAGFLPVSVMLAMIGLEYTQSDVFAMLAGVLALATIAAFVPQARASRLAFVAIGLMLVA